TPSRSPTRYKPRARRPSTRAATPHAVTRRFSRRRSITLSASRPIHPRARTRGLRDVGLFLRGVARLIVALGALALRLRCRLLVVLAFLLVSGRAEDIAKRRAGLGRAVLRYRLLLLGDLQRLDRNRDLARLGIDLGHDGIELLADAEAIGPLLRTVARQVGSADEGGEVVINELGLKPIVLGGGHFARHPPDLLQFRRRGARGERVGGELFDAEADALLLAIAFEYHRLGHISLLVFLK